MVNKQARGVKTKKEILNTALLLFTQKGYNNVTVEEIVKKSNSSKGSFYAHYASKSELLLEKFKEIDDFYLHAINEIPNDLSGKEKIVEFINKQMTYISEDLGIDLMKVVYTNALTTNPHDYFLDETRPLFEILRTYVTECFRNGETTSNLEPDDLVNTINSAMFGSIYKWSMCDGKYDLVKDSETTFKVIVEGF